MHSGPRAKSMHLWCGQPSCAHACQLTTFLIVTDTYIRMYVRHTIGPHSEPRDRSATRGEDGKKSEGGGILCDSKVLPAYTWSISWQL